MQRTIKAQLVLKRQVKADTGSILEGEWCGIMGENLGTEVLTKVKAVE